MSDLVKGVLGGGWSLLVGWLLPAGLNVLAFAFVVLPLAYPARKPAGDALVLGVAAIVVGLLLAAVQTPLYRLLEGYVGWRPSAAPRRGLARLTLAGLLHGARERQLRRRRVLLGRLDLVELTALEAAGRLTGEDAERLAEVRDDPELARYRGGDAQRTAAQLGLVRERLARYPVDEAQVVPTRLGNAIRRLEEYGYDRYRLDSQRMWHELTAVAPERAAKQVEQSRTTVDLLVCLLAGNVLVAVVAGVLAVTTGRHRWLLAGVAVALLVLARAWYEVAVQATDDWAAAVRALVNVGRAPLADALALSLPPTIGAEREMWGLVASLMARPYHPRRAALDRYRNPADRRAGD
jgi:hypothetical protein